MADLANLSERDRATVLAMQDALRLMPEHYRKHQAAGNIWIEGYIAGAVGPAE